MRNLTTAISATLTAIVIGLLIANVANAARAAEIQHDKDAQLAAIQDQAYTADMTSQLKAYQTRYGQTYAQLAEAYKAYYQRDAEYRQIVARANANASALANANASLEARLNEAYAALREAQTLIAQLRAGGAVAPAAPAPQGPTAPRVTQPTAAPRTPQPVPTEYCWYDREGHYVCEDHPQGQ